MNSNEVEILSETIDFIKKIELDEGKFFNHKLRENRSGVHNPFLKRLKDFFLKLSEVNEDLCSPEREYTIEVHYEKGQIIEGKCYEKDEIREYSADVVVKNTSDETLFHIEVDSSFLEKTVPLKFDLISAKYQIWVFLPAADKKHKKGIDKFYGWIEYLVYRRGMMQSQNGNLVCILKYPNFEPQIEIF